MVSWSVVASGQRSWRPLAGAALWLVAAGLWSSSCVLGGLSTDNLCGKLDHVDPTCDACSAESCCEEERACRESAACSALYDCLDGCGQDAPCIEACAGQHDGDEVGAALLRCRRDRCLPECLSCGNIPTDSTAACDKCLRRTCCAEQMACAADPGCVELAQCALSCPTPGCDTMCLASGTEAEAAESRALFTAAIACSVTGCQADCGYGTDFSCVQAFDYPLADPTPAEVHLRFVGLYGAPVPGMLVRACEALDADCEAPLDTGTTDDGGEVRLTVPTPSTGFDGYFIATKTGFLDALFFSGYPLASSTARSTLRAISFEQIGDVEAFLGGANDPSRGHLLAIAIDCVGTLAFDLALDVGPAADDESVGFYFDGGLPKTGLTSTTGQGIGGFVNLLPGPVTVTGRTADGEVVSSAVVEVRPGSLTSVQLPPIAR